MTSRSGSTCTNCGDAPIGHSAVCVKVGTECATIPDMPAPDLRDFIAGLPKVELHVHHVGSASQRTVAALADRYAGTTEVPNNPDLLTDYFAFTDFAHFVDVYLSVVGLIREPADIRLLTYEVAQDLAAQQVRYAELTMTPYSHVLLGIPGAAYVEAIEDARVAAERDFGLTLRWCFDVNGADGIPGAEATLAIALDYRPAGLVSFGLGGREIGVSRAPFADVFARAKAAGLHSVPHAGETTGPETIWEALELLGAERIGHGTSAVRDARLLTQLAERRIPLEVCPTSNVRTRVVPDLASHPLPQMVEAGVVVTINSDDPSMFDTTLNREYEIAAELLGLDEVGVAGLAKNAVTASFLAAPRKALLLAEIDGYVTR
jgi:aminodeoxyfutalosine deaminase